MKKTIAIDFDGVLASYDGWKGPDLLGAPLPGAIEALRDYLEAGYQVCIFTTRAADEAGANRLRNWLIDAGLTPTLQNEIQITDKKPPAWLYIDDRVYLFTGQFPTRNEIDDFTPWWDKK